MREIKAPKKPFLERLGMFADKVVGILNPIAGYRRTAARKAMGMLKSYRGSDKNRLRDSWLPGGGSADEDLLPELADLRERSRDLNRNDPVAAGITNTMTINVVGTGIKPQSRVDKESLGITDEDATAFQKKAEREFERWVSYADAGERMDFFELQHLVDRQILENGEVILIPLMLKDKNRPYALAFDVIESDRLSTPLDLRSDKSIRYGVKIGKRGEPLKYYIRKTHPGDVLLRKDWKSNNFLILDAKNKAGRKNVLHLYWVNRPGQTRGVPFFAPVLTYFKDMADYMEAELVAARISACFALFITKPDAIEAANARTSSTNAAGQQIEAIEPGMVEYLENGEKIESFKPERPGSTFDPFINRILRSICGALNLPYEIVANDFSKTNYSSARAALLEARRYFKVRQEWLARKFCQPAWEMLLEEAFLKDNLETETFYENFLDWVRVRWITPGWSWVDPVKEAKSSQMAIEIGVSSLADEAAAQGKDYEEVLEQQAREKALRKELGLPDPLQKKTVGEEKDAIPVRLVTPDGKEKEKEEKTNGLIQTVNTRLKMIKKAEKQAGNILKKAVEKSKELTQIGENLREVINEGFRDIITKKE